MEFDGRDARVGKKWGNLDEFPQCVAGLAFAHGDECAVCKGRKISTATQ